MASHSDDGQEEEQQKKHTRTSHYGGGRDLDDDGDEDIPLPKQPLRPIQRLDEAVVNRIAAGEIIHRPANALKELIENSIDAGSTLVQITLKDGGLKSLQIRDNGSGIPQTDLPLLCERFATSKLRRFDDLERMTTFGFRGEALASISFVSASMSVITKTPQQPLALKAFYANGQLAPAKTGQSAEPKPCAGTDGTIITAEDLFYNVPQRRRALKSVAEEYNRCLEVAAKYALHYASRGVGFVCKKSGSNSTDLSTASSTSTETIDTIRLLHGNAVAREVVHLHPPADHRLGFRVEGWISSANWSAKRMTFLCFINDRLVDCSSLKRSLENLYAAMLPKGGHPWIYLGLHIEPSRVDVNVHPTKQEVHFLDEDDIVEAVCTSAQETLAGANASRTFQFTQTLFPSANLRTSQQGGAHASDGNADTTAIQPHSRFRASQSQNPQHQVRVDARVRTLDSMFAASSTPYSTISQRDGTAGGKELDNKDFTGETAPQMPPAAAAAASASVTSRSSNRTAIPESDCTLTSIRDLRRDVAKHRHTALAEILQEHIFVGVVDISRSLSLLQHSTKLYLFDHDALIEEACYQLCLRQFGSIQKTTLEPGVPLDELLRLGLDVEVGPFRAAEAAKDEQIFGGLRRDEAISKMSANLRKNAEMLAEYFSLEIDAQKNLLVGIPRLVPDRASPSSTNSSTQGTVVNAGVSNSEIVLPLDNLPSFLVRLGPQVDWTDEKACFESFARELAYAHTVAQQFVATSSSSSSSSIPSSHRKDGHSDCLRRFQQHEQKRLGRIISHKWMPALGSLCRRGTFYPPRSLVQEERLIQITSLNELYRIFERC